MQYLTSQLSRNQIGDFTIQNTWFICGINADLESISMSLKAPWTSITIVFAQHEFSRKEFSSDQHCLRLECMQTNACLVQQAIKLS